MRRIGSCIVVLAFLSAPAYGAVIGETINIEWDASYYGMVLSQDAVVGEGYEYICPVGAPMHPEYVIDITENKIIVINQGGGWGPGPFNGYIFTDKNNTIPDFTSFTLESYTYWQPSIDPICSYNANQLIVNINPSTESMQLGGVVMYTFEFATAPIPEPSTLLLLGSGLVGLVGYGRKRMKK